MGQKYRIIEQMEQQGKDVTQEAVRLIQEHGSITPIARLWGVTPAAVSYHLKRAGYVYRRSTTGEGSQWEQIADGEIINKYVELSDEYAVARYFGIAQSYVHDVLLRELDTQLQGDLHG